MASNSEIKLDPFGMGGQKSEHRQLITILMEDYHASNNGLTLSEEDSALLQRLVTTPPRNRSGSFSASARGTCERAQVFQYLDAPKTGRDTGPTLQSVFIDGTWRHLRWQMTLMSAGRQFGVPVQVEVPFIDESLRLRGSLDGIVDGRGFELKGTRSFSNARTTPFSSHLLQIQSYMLLADLDLFSLVYEDKATQQTAEHIVVKNPEVERKVMDEIEALNRAVDSKTLPKMLDGCCGDGKKSQTWWDCAYRKTCESAQYSLIEEEVARERLQ